MDSQTILIGNIICAIGLVIDLFSVSRKKAKTVLTYQLFSYGCYGLSTFILKGYTATVQDIFSIIRNAFAIMGVKSKALQIFLVSLPVVIGVIINNRGFIGLFPVVGNLVYAISMFFFDGKVIPLKIGLLLDVCLFFVFNFTIQNYVGMANNALMFLTTLGFVIRTLKSEKSEEKNM